MASIIGQANQRGALATGLISGRNYGAPNATARALSSRSTDSVNLVIRDALLFGYPPVAIASTANSIALCMCALVIGFPIGATANATSDGACGVTIGVATGAQSDATSSASCDIVRMVALDATADALSDATCALGLSVALVCTSNAASVASCLMAASGIESTSNATTSTISNFVLNNRQRRANFGAWQLHAKEKASLQIRQKEKS